MRVLLLLSALSLLLLPTVATAEWDPDVASDDEVVAYLASSSWKERFDAAMEVKKRCMADAEPRMPDVLLGDSHHKVRLAVMKALTKCKWASARAAVDAAVISDTEKRVRRKALRYIELVGTADSVPVLAKVLERDPDVALRERAALVLTKRRWSGAEAVQERCARQEVEPDLRGECVRGLFTIDRGKWAPLMIEVMTTDPSVDVRREMARWFLEAPAREVRDGLVTLLDDPEPKVQIDAARALAAMGDRSVAPILLEKAGSAWDKKVREEFTEAAMRLGG